MSTDGNRYISRLSHLRLTRICVPIVGSDPADLVEKADALSRDNPFIELRVDYLYRPSFAFSKIRQFVQTELHVTVIASCRRVANGGKFKGSIAAELGILSKANEA